MNLDLKSEIQNRIGLWILEWNLDLKSEIHDVILDLESKIQRVELYLENRIQVDLILGFGF
jgi:hypothetical protein